MKRLALLVLTSLLLALPALACGDDRAERGLAPADEEAVPVSEGALRQTEAERRAQQIREEQAAEAEEFDEGPAE